LSEFERRRKEDYEMKEEERRLGVAAKATGGEATMDISASCQSPPACCCRKEL
jgi:hypothetical protein